MNRSKKMVETICETIITVVGIIAMVYLFTHL